MAIANIFFSLSSAASVLAVKQDRLRNDDIGLDRHDRTDKILLFHGGADPAGMRMVFCQPVDMMLQCIDTCRSHKARLAHPAAEYFADPATLPDKGRRPHQDTSDGTAHAFIQTDGNAVEKPPKSVAAPPVATKALNSLAPSRCSFN
jgi:hypothetical protein